MDFERVLPDPTTYTVEHLWWSEMWIPTGAKNPQIGLARVDATGELVVVRVANPGEALWFPEVKPGVVPHPELTLLCHANDVTTGLIALEMLCG